jgi:2-polyprenyl-3-methyl-5-hydroxy-6-metoxy-1,4-benzoquinol methylase/glycosyltransferase involved in cell wall biosynthesis
MKYDFEYNANNVYGHAVSLIKRFGASSGVHLDLGCGYGRIAEPISEIGLQYIGIDAEKSGLDSLSERGFRTYQHFFGDFENDINFIEKIIEEENIVSVSAIDILEHLPNANVFLNVVHKICVKNNIPLIISVPNTSHNDVAYKLLFDKFDYIDAGILDSTHLKLFTEKSITSLMEEHGFYQIGENDIHYKITEQHFPEDNILFSENATLTELLNNVRMNMNSNYDVYQLVRVFLPSTNKNTGNKEKGNRPFLSIITRTQGKRENSLIEMILTLTGQTCTDFELILMGHKLEKDRQIAVEKIIEETPDWMREKIRLIVVDSGNRTRPLNVGFTEAKGKYIVILDDDDIVFSNWVETFKNLYESNSGKILRSVIVGQDVSQVETPYCANSVSSDSKFIHNYPAEFDFIRQLTYNQTPCLSVAFPRSAFHDLNIKFDETLDTTEDWDFIMRTFFLCGIACSPNITGVYRLWQNAHNSTIEHDQEIWKNNEDYISNKFNQSYIILPPGSAKKIATIFYSSVNNSIEAYTNNNTILTNIILILTSAVWKLCWPVGLIDTLCGNKIYQFEPDKISSKSEQGKLLNQILNSKRWKATLLIRKLLKK